MNEPDVFLPADLCKLVREECVNGNALQGVMCGGKLFHDADAVNDNIRCFLINYILDALQVVCMDLSYNIFSFKNMMVSNANASPRIVPVTEK